MKHSDGDNRSRVGTVTTLFSGVVVGIVGTLTAMWVFGPRLMMQETESPYDFTHTTERFETTVENTAGWKILGTLDLQAKMDAHGYDVERITVYEICSPDYAVNILECDDERLVSPMMPCRVSIYEKSNGQTYVGRMNSGLMARLFGGVVQRTMADAHADAETMIEKTLESSEPRKITID